MLVTNQSINSFHFWAPVTEFFHAIKKSVIFSIATYVFHVVFAVRIHLTLSGSIAFLLTLNGEHALKNAARYRKIVRFSVIICVITFVYNLLLEGIQTFLLVRDNMIINVVVVVIFLEVNPVINRLFSILGYVMNVAVSFKPVCYAAAYVWITGNLLP